jgi:hypothetical protein
LLAHEHRTHERAEHDNPSGRGDPEDTATGDLEVVERVRRATLSDEEGDQCGEGDRCQPERQRAHVRNGGEVDRQDERRDENDGQDSTQVVDRIRRFVDVARDEEQRHYQGDRGQRQRDQEDRAPPELLEQSARDHGAEGRNSAPDARPQRDRLRAPRSRPERRDQRERRRERHAGGQPAEDASDEKDVVGRRPRSQHGRRNRECRAQDQHELASVAVADRSEVEHRRGEAQGIADRDQIERRLPGIELLGNRRKRDIGHGQVEVGDGRYQDERDEDKPRTVGARRRAVHSFSVLVGAAADAELPSRSSTWFPTRSEFAIAVNAGFTAPMLGKMLVSTT